MVPSGDERQRAAAEDRLHGGCYERKVLLPEQRHDLHIAAINEGALGPVPAGPEVVEAAVAGCRQGREPHRHVTDRLGPPARPGAEAGAEVERNAEKGDVGRPRGLWRDDRCLQERGRPEAGQAESLVAFSLVGFAHGRLTVRNSRP